MGKLVLAILSEHDVFIFVAELGIIILFARIFGEIAIKLGQPIIVGEVLAGIVLGSTVFGNFSPEWYAELFPDSGPHPYLLQGISWLCVMFLLLITGLEVDVRAAIRQGKSTMLISLFGLFLPLIGVFSVIRLLPTTIYPDNVNPFYVQLLLTIGLSVVAIPVIAKILFDLKILRSEVGLKILTSGVLSDVWGWSILAVIISLIDKGSVTLVGVVQPLLTMAVFIGLAVTIGQKLVDWIFELIGYRVMDTTVAISLIFALGLCMGAVAHLLGIHVIFGAFIAGIMAGESEKITPYLREWIQNFIFAVFSPIFFALIGMQLVIPKGEVWLFLGILLVVATGLRFLGAYLGGIMAGLGKNNAVAVSCGLNTQGTMGIVVALIGLDLGVFNNDLFSIVVIICVATSLLVGPLLKWAIKGVRRPLADFFDKEHVFMDLEGKNKKEVIGKMAEAMERRELIADKKNIREAIWNREMTLSTAIGEGVALPHARITNLKEPVLCFFKLKKPVDYGSPDNKPVQLLFLELTDRDDDGMHLNLIAQVARFISSSENRKKLLDCDKAEDIHHILSFDEKA